MTSDYRLSPALAARLLGVSLVLWGAVVFAATAVVVLFAVPPVFLSVVVVACVAGVFATGWFLTRSTYVVRLDEDGYHVRFVRGAGVTRARWTDVEDAVTTVVAGAPCVVFRLRDGGSTTIPVDVLVGDRDDFVRQVRAHLDRHGRRAR
ncbi:hypothetical protein EKO23_02000 [Nocardioides guangzhouensis]|uniref:Uncharacterized protein n=1 Tax=Nocardioides guangzhouensis TaxID=2497878 RepID=A0A4Q4ZM41_9ACTN|nr:hypothetical protein [Nocardioides guangzhouensis]RYP88681.1 hypothetical protein EKO23_02000 [Nocardioides guangzhouensis]